MSAARVALFGIPLLVAVSVTLLMVLAVVTAVEPGFDATKVLLFVGGVGAWALGISWGLAVNARTFATPRRA